MIIRAIQVFVKPDAVDAFKEASKRNHEGSMKEPGVLRFDVLQSAEDRSRFLLYEVYTSVEATQAHKETAHYKAWKDAVEPMMDRPRESAAYTPVAPIQEEEWR